MSQALPEITCLLDRKVRVQLGHYSRFGYVGSLIREAVAYIALLEEELARREAKDA